MKGLAKGLAALIILSLLSYGASVIEKRFHEGAKKESSLSPELREKVTDISENAASAAVKAILAPLEQIADHIAKENPELHDREPLIVDESFLIPETPQVPSVEERLKPLTDKIAEMKKNQAKN